MRARRIPDAVLTVLSLAQVDGLVVRLHGQLPRALYEETNDVLAALGGRWNRKAKGHVFTEDPAELLEAALLTGEYERPQDFGFFPTPPPVVERLIEAAAIQPWHRCLEPSAGHGAIAAALAKLVEPAQVDTIELQASACEILRAQGCRPQCGDFLSLPLKTRYDRIVMNPPFGRQQDLAHVTRAFGLLRPGGRLVSVMAAGLTFRADRQSVECRALVEAYGRWEWLPDESFRASGTGVRTVMVTLIAPQEDTP